MKHLQRISEAEDSTVEEQSTANSDDTESKCGDTPEAENKSQSFTETVRTGDYEDKPASNELSETCEFSSAGFNAHERASEDKTTPTKEKPAVEQSKTDNVYHSDYRFGLRLRVHYRINEEAIRCLLLVRWVQKNGVVCKSLEGEVRALLIPSFLPRIPLPFPLPFRVLFLFQHTVVILALIRAHV